MKLGSLLGWLAASNLMAHLPSVVSSRACDVEANYAVYYSSTDSGVFKNSRSIVVMKRTTQ